MERDCTSSGTCRGSLARSPACFCERIEGEGEGIDLSGSVFQMRRNLSVSPNACQRERERSFAILLRAERLVCSGPAGNAGNDRVVGVRVVLGEFVGQAAAACQRTWTGANMPNESVRRILFDIRNESSLRLVLVSGDCPC